MIPENNFTPRLSYISIATFTLLMIPLIAMQFTSEINWTASDFLFAGLLIFGSGLAYKIANRKTSSTLYKIALASAIGSGLFLVWINAAVGIIGSENNDFNMFYFSVILVGFIGSVFSRFKPKGLARTMIAMAVTHAIITLAALIMGSSELPNSSLFEILSLNGLFIVLYIFPAILFKNAVEENPDT